jgi:hypothetical protein
MAKQHLILHKNLLDIWVIDCTIPYLPDDPNHGLPPAYFEGEVTGRYLDFEIDKEADIIEWWPGMGPAPHWSAKYSPFKNSPQALMEVFTKWYGETY